MDLEIREGQRIGLVDALNDWLILDWPQGEELVQTFIFCLSSNPKEY